MGPACVQWLFRARAVTIVSILGQGRECQPVPVLASFIKQGPESRVQSPESRVSHNRTQPVRHTTAVGIAGQSRALRRGEEQSRAEQRRVAQRGVERQPHQ